MQSNSCLRAVLIVVLIAAALVPLTGTAEAAVTGTCTELGTGSITVTCTTGDGTWTPPAGVTTARFTLNGAGGGASSAGESFGGKGGQTLATVTVDSATTYRVTVGAAGGDGIAGGAAPAVGGTGGAPGGAPGTTGSGHAGGGGGGVSFVRDTSGVDPNSDWLLAAGGAGGAGGGTRLGADGGAGGGAIGGDGLNGTGGPGGDGANQDGTSGNGVNINGGRGGGGGGYYGGGGIGIDAGGAGGGSGLIRVDPDIGPGATTTTGAGAERGKDGSVVIEYEMPDDPPPPPPTTTTTVSGQPTTTTTSTTISEQPTTTTTSTTPADSEPESPPDRLEGPDRIATAVEISRVGFENEDATAVVLARHDVYADALAGTPLAVARNAPLLLTPTHQLDPRVAAEMQRILPPGGTVYILGGPKAIAEETENAVRALEFNTERFQGADRYGTAVAIADELGNPETLLLATGIDFPDAASAGAAGASQDGAVLLTVGDQLPPVTKSYLEEHPTATRFAVGGPAAAADPGATPLFGGGRYETAVAVAEEFFDDADAVGVVSGVEFADAITGGTHMGRLRGPILLTAPAALPEPTRVWLQDHASNLADAFIFGGTNAVSTAVEDAIRVALNS